MEAKQLAARLRSIRRLGGMVMHPNASDVMNEDQIHAVFRALDALRKITPITGYEFYEYVMAGRRDVKVVIDHDGKPKFTLSDSEGQAATFLDAESNIPVVHRNPD